MTVRHRSSATASVFNPDEVTTTTDVSRQQENTQLSSEPEGTAASQDPIQLNEGDEDDDNLTIIGLDNDIEQDNSVQIASTLGWMHQNRPEMEERRRNILLRELQRVQRISFIHFSLLCLIPTTLLIIVVASVVRGNEDCNTLATTCVKEARTFMNAFTTRCICDAIDVNEG